MALRFFRKHKKVGFGLLIAAVFAMVSFGALWQLPDAWRRWTGDPRLKVVVMEVYGKEVQRREALKAQWNLIGAGEFGRFVLSYYQTFQFQKDTLRRVNAMMQYASPMPSRYTRAGDDRDERHKVVQATVVLLREAEELGIRVSDDTIEAYLEQWTAAGVDANLMNAIVFGVFKGDREYFYDCLRQEMVLAIYLDSMRGGARVFKEDVAEAFAQENDKVSLDEVVFKAADYLKDVAEPTAEEISAQFEKYKDVLPGDQADGFGYKIPDRIKVAYLSVSAGEFEKDATVSEDEIKAYYEENKYRYVVSEEKKEDDKPEEGKADGTGSEGKAEKAGAEEEPAKGEPEKNAGGETNPPKVLNFADAEATGTGPGATVAEAAASGETAVAAPAVPDARTEARPTEPERPAVPEGPARKYRPLEEVRADIERTLRREKAEEACWKKAEAAMSRLIRQPQLSLEHVADGKYLKYHEPAGFLTREQVAELPGIGASKFVEDPKNLFGESVPFGALAFKVKPLAADGGLHLNRPGGPTIDFFRNCYVFVVTAVDPAHRPASLDQVREEVVGDLKKVAGYGLAEKASAGLIEEARQKGLHEAAKAAGLKVEKRLQPLTRFDAKTDSKLAKAAFEAVDGGQKVGKVGSATCDEARVFEITELLHGTEKDYRDLRDQLAVRAIGQAELDLMRKFVEPEAVIKRGGLKVLKPIEPGQEEMRDKAPPSESSSTDL